MRDGVRKTRCAVESTCVSETCPILACDTAPQNAPRMSDLQSRPTKVSQTMSCHTASRRSGRQELVSSTTATTDLHEPSERSLKPWLVKNKQSPCPVCAGRRTLTIG